MKVTFYVGDYTRKTGNRAKGKGVSLTTDSVERVRIDELPDGAIVDRPASAKDKTQYAEAYAAFKNPPKVEPKSPPQPAEEPLHSKPRFYGSKKK